MRIPKISNLLLCVSLLTLTACGGGGGGTPVASLGSTGSSGATTGSTSGSSGTTTGSTGGSSGSTSGGTDSSSGTSGSGSSSGTTSGSTGGSSGSTSGGTDSSSGASSSGSGTTTGSTGGSSGSTSSGSSSSSSAGTSTPSTVFATGPTPNFIPANAPAIGTVFPVAGQTILKADYNAGVISILTPAGQATLTYGGTQSEPASATPVSIFTLNVPGISLKTSSIVALFNTNENYQVLNYTFIGNWNRSDANTSNLQYIGGFTTGFQTPISGIPTSGLATYLGISGAAGTPGTAGGVVGTVFTACGTNEPCMIQNLQGNASLTVDFGKGTVSGSLTSLTLMTGRFTQTFDVFSDINLTGSLSGAAINGATSVGSNNSKALTAAAAGTFSGALNGPNGQELGASFTLSDPTRTGKISVVGSFAATKQ